MTMFARLALVAALAFPGLAPADTYPSKPVHVVLGFSPGGSIDGFARLLSPVLSKQLGQPVVVDNRPGANGVIAMDYVAKSAPDGHTIFMGASGNLSLNHLYYANLPFDIEKDFAPVTQLNSVTFLLMTNPSVPAKTVQELVSYIKKNPGKVNFSSAGVGSTPHLAGELFNSIAGVQATHVPYKGAGQSIADLVAGRVQFTIDSMSVGMPHVKSGRLNLLATTTPQRLAGLPDVPSAAEALPGLIVVNWYGLVAPARTPKEVIARLHEAVVAALGAPELQKRMAADGMQAVGSAPEAFGAFMRSESGKWARVIKEAGIRLE